MITFQIPLSGNSWGDRTGDGDFKRTVVSWHLLHYFEGEEGADSEENQQKHLHINLCHWFLKIISDSQWWVWPFLASGCSPRHFLPPPQQDSKRCKGRLFSLTSILTPLSQLLQCFQFLFLQRYHQLCWRSLRSLWSVVGPFRIQLEPALSNQLWTPELFWQKLPPLPKPCHIKKCTLISVTLLSTSTTT